jgi:hypothetical protein
MYYGCQPYAPADFTPRNRPWYLFLLEVCQTQGHSAAGKIMSIKNSNDTIGNRTRKLPTCSAVPQPTAPPCAPQQQLLFVQKHLPLTLDLIVTAPNILVADVFGNGIFY